jgi:hypothetical protein
MPDPQKTTFLNLLESLESYIRSGIDDYLHDNDLETYIEHGDGLDDFADLIAVLRIKEFVTRCNMLNAIATFQHDLSQFLGEDSSFEEIDEAIDNLWRDAFDAMGIPNGVIRTKIFYAATKPEPGSNLDHAIERGDSFYDNYFDSRREEHV